MATLVGDDKLMFDVVRWQNFDGSFPVSNELCDLIHVDINRINKESIEKSWDSKAWMTALVLAFFVKRLAALQNDWDLVAEKAKTFLNEEYAVVAVNMFQVALSYY